MRIKAFPTNQKDLVGVRNASDGCVRDDGGDDSTRGNGNAAGEGERMNDGMRTRRAALIEPAHVRPAGARPRTKNLHVSQMNHIDQTGRPLDS